MTIEKAIEILAGLEKTLAPIMAADGTDAIKLGIEALNLVKARRPPPPSVAYLPLPGETEV